MDNFNEKITNHFSDFISIHNQNRIEYSEISKSLVQYLEEYKDHTLTALIYDENFNSIKKISSINNKIKSTTFSINNTIETLESNAFSKKLENRIINQINELLKISAEIKKSLDSLNDKFHDLKPGKLFYTELNPKPIMTTTINNLNKSTSTNLIDLTYETSSYIFNLIKKIEIQSQSLLQSITILKNEILNIQKQHENLKNLDYISRFQDETNLIIKQYTNNISNLTSKFETKFKDFELDQEKIKNSSDLMINGVNTGLESLNLLTERIQKLDSEISTIINEKSKIIDRNLEISKNNFENQINALRNRTNVKTEKIKIAHKDFVQLVQNAGIYKLTENYDKKAKEEKKYYNIYSGLTIGSIVFAIVATIIIISLPIIEHWKANPPVDTNYYTILARLTISLMFFVLAVYTSKRAAKHYECYQENHRTFLQLAALEPFMARMNEDEQKEIRKGLIPSYFNQSADGKFASKADEVDLPTNIHAIVNRAFDLVGEKKNIKPGESVAAETKPQG